MDMKHTEHFKCVLVLVQATPLSARFSCVKKTHWGEQSTSSLLHPFFFLHSDLASPLFLSLSLSLSFPRASTVPVFQWAHYHFTLGLRMQPHTAGPVTAYSGTNSTFPLSLYSTLLPPSIRIKNLFALPECARRKRRCWRLIARFTQPSLWKRNQGWTRAAQNCNWTLV